MENTVLKEKLMADLDSINTSIKQNQESISKIKEDILKIKDSEVSLKKIYPDLCELEQIQSNMQSQKANLENCDEDKIKELQVSENVIREKLGRMGIKDRQDYERLVNEVKENKNQIHDMEADIIKKEQQNEELQKKKASIERELEGTSQFDKESSRNLSKTSKKNTASELAAFIDYDTEEEESLKVEEPKKVEKKHEEIEDVIDNMISKQKNVMKKFEEIIEESTNNELKESMKGLQNRFQKDVYQDIYQITYNMLQKRREINDIEKEAKASTNEGKRQKLEELNETLTSAINNIEALQQKFENQVRDNFNNFKTQATDEFNSLQTLRQQIIDESSKINDKINDIEEKLNNIRLNSKEKILEDISKIQEDIGIKRNDGQQLENTAKENVVNLLEMVKKDVEASDSYDSFMKTIDYIKEQIAKEEQTIKDKKDELDKELEGLEQKKSSLEEKYKQKKEEGKDEEEEARLQESKKALKDESQKVVEMVNKLSNQKEELTQKIQQAKQDIKADIRKKDDDIISQKNDIINSATKGKTALPVRLQESIDEYNKKYIFEFDNLIRKVSQNIEQIEKENKENRAKTNNVVVLSEFDENSQLLNELKDLLNKGVETKKDIQTDVVVQEEQTKSSIENELEQKIRNIKIEDTIDSKIDFGEIYQIEDSIINIDDIIKSVHDMCEKLDMEQEIKKQEDKPQPEKVAIQDKQINKVARDTENDQEKNKRRANMLGLDEYSKEEQEVLKDIPWEQLVELKNMNKQHQRTLKLDDLKALKDEKVKDIAKLKEEYNQAVSEAKKLYEIKKYVLAYKKGMDELAKGGKSDDKDEQKKHANFMKVATKSLKIMKENGILSFEDFRNKVIKNSEQVKQILADTKVSNEELVKLTGLIQSIEKSSEPLVPKTIQKEM